MTLTSMTGFADLTGGTDALAWTWEARSVNGRGLDVRLRLPDGLDSLDAPVRAAAGAPPRARLGDPRPPPRPWRRRRRSRASTTPRSPPPSKPRSPRPRPRRVPASTSRR